MANHKKTFSLLPVVILQTSNPENQALSHCAINYPKLLVLLETMDAIISLLILFLSLVSTTNGDNNLDVCDGQATKWLDYPYIATLTYAEGGSFPGGTQCCSASIISLNPPKILSSADCMWFNPDVAITTCTGPVIIGCDDVTKPYCNGQGEQYEILSYEFPPTFHDYSIYTADVTVITLTKPITYPGATVIKYATIPPLQVSQEWRIIGYGSTSSLSTGITTYIPYLKCGVALGQWFYYLDPSMVCIWNGGNTTQPSSCFGDFGGPMIYNDIQYGIMSFGFANCQPCGCCTQWPQMGVNVALFAPWIANQTAN
eukprot:141717_1